MPLTLRPDNPAFGDLNEGQMMVIYPLLIHRLPMFI